MSGHCQRIDLATLDVKVLPDTPYRKLRARAIKLLMASKAGGAGRKILFLCVANSARSQMAEGFARTWFGDQVRVESAGSQPSSLHPTAVKAMAEIGIDVSHQHAKRVDTIDPAEIDTVITLCAKEACPAFLGKARQLHWPIRDPAGGGRSGEEPLQHFREARDEIARRLKAFAKEQGLGTRATKDWGLTTNSTISRPFAPAIPALRPRIAIPDSGARRGVRGRPGRTCRDPGQRTRNT